MPTPRVIALSCKPEIRDDDGTLAVEALIPGHLLIEGASGFSKNTANATNVSRCVALERDELGKDIDTAYAIGDQVKVGIFRSGQRGYVFLASGQNVAKGARLVGDNAGLFTATGVTTAIAIAKAAEAKDATAGAVAGTRIRVEFI